MSTNSFVYIYIFFFSKYCVFKYNQINIFIRYKIKSQFIFFQFQNNIDFYGI